MITPFLHGFGNGPSPRENSEQIEQEEDEEDINDDSFIVKNEMIIRQIQMLQAFPLTPVGSKLAQKVREDIKKKKEILECPHSLFYDCFDKVMNKKVAVVNPNIFKTTGAIKQPDFV